MGAADAESEDATGSSDATEADGSGGDVAASPPACPPWAIADLTTGACQPVGPKGCSAESLDAEGRCNPPDCATGRPGIPVPCSHVGPNDCPSDRATDDLLCAPAPCNDPAGLPAPRPPLVYPGQSCQLIGITTCAPELADTDGVCRPLPERCASGELALPERGCVPLWEPPHACPESPLDAVTPKSGDVFVAPGASPGDGSRDAPVATIAEALELAAKGKRIVLLPGTYPEPVHITRDVSLVAACPGSVSLTGAAQTPKVPAAVWVQDADVKLEGLRITADGAGVLVTSGGDVTTDRTDISGCLLAAVLATGFGSDAIVTTSRLAETRLALLGDRNVGIGAFADDGGKVTLVDTAVLGNRTYGVLSRYAPSTATLEGVAIVGTASNDEGLFGRGVQALWGGTASVARTFISGSHDAGAFAFEGTLTMTESVVEGTLPLDGTPAGAYDGRFGEGIAADGGATVEVERTQVVANTSTGVSSYGAGTVIALTESHVRDTLPGYVDVPGDAGRGVEAAFGGRLELTRSAVTGNREAGVFVNGEGAEAHLSGSLVSHTTASKGGGDGVLAIDGARAKLDGTVVIANTASGVLARGLGTTIEIASCEVSGTEAGQDAGGAGYGIAAQEGAAVTVELTSIRANAGAGVFAADAGTYLTLSKSLVRGTLPSGAGTHGRGVNVQLGASAKLVDVTIEDSHDIGLFAQLSGGSLEGKGLLVRRTAPDAASGTGGRGIELQMGEATLSNVLVADCPDGALLVSGDGADVTVEDAALIGPENEGSLGAVAQAGARVTIRRAAVERARGSGALAADGAQLILESVSVRGVAKTDRTTGTGEQLHGIGDGVAAISGSTVLASGVRAEQCGRAGILFSGSGGSLVQSTAYGNAYGVVLQDDAGPKIDGTNLILGNQILDVWTDGALPTPPPPKPAKL